jgi:hypothetical protein
MALCLDGLAAVEIAEITGLSLGAIATRVHRLKATLARLFQVDALDAFRWRPLASDRSSPTPGPVAQGEPYPLPPLRPRRRSRPSLSESRQTWRRPLLGCFQPRSPLRRHRLEDPALGGHPILAGEDLGGHFDQAGQKVGGVGRRPRVGAQRGSRSSRPSDPGVCPAGPRLVTKRLIS